MAGQVGNALLEGVQVFGGELVAGESPVVFQGADCCHDHDCGYVEVAGAGFDVEEFFRPQVGAETAFGEDHVGVRQCGAGGDEGVAAVGDVSERAAVDEGGGAAQGLHQVGVDGVFEEGGEGALGVDVTGGDGFPIVGLGDHHAADAVRQVGQVGGEAEDRHDFAGGGDGEPGFGRHPVGFAAQAGDHVPVIDVDAPLPRDPARVDAELVTLVDVVVDHGRQGVVGGGDCVEVPGKVQVDVFHGDDLGVAAAGGAAFDAHDWAEGGFPDGYDGGAAGGPDGVGKPDEDGGFTFTGWGGGNAGDEDEFAGCFGGGGGDVDFGFGGAVGDEGLFWDAGAGGDGGDGFEGVGLGDFDVGRHGGFPPWCCGGVSCRGRGCRETWGA